MVVWVKVIAALKVKVSFKINNTVEEKALHRHWVQGEGQLPDQLRGQRQGQNSKPENQSPKRGRFGHSHVFNRGQTSYHTLPAPFRQNQPSYNQDQSTFAVPG